MRRDATAGLRRLADAWRRARTGRLRRVEAARAAGFVFLRGRFLVAMKSPVRQLCGISAAINRALARSFEQQDLQRTQGALDARFARLTPRQIEIFDQVVEGFTNQAIAAKLNISVRTVESYRTEVMEKMQAESIAGLVRQAIRLGRIAP